VVKEFKEEITGWEAETALKGGKHHNLIRVGCWDIFAQCGLGESGSQQVCESCLHPRRASEIGAGVRQPWLGKALLWQRIKACIGDRVCKEVVEEMAVVREMIRFQPDPLFNSGSNKGHVTVHMVALGIRVNGQVYPNGKKSHALSSKSMARFIPMVKIL
jgi:hypothetical protein